MTGPLPESPKSLQEKIALAKRETLAQLMNDVISTFLAEGFRLEEVLEAVADYTHLHDFGGATFHIERAALSVTEEHKLTYPTPQEEEV